MNSISLQSCADELQGQLVGDDVDLSSFSTDTRTLQDGDTFIALKGPNHDAHDHLKLAIERGAAALIVERATDCEIPQLVVQDTRLALGKLARLWSQSFQIPVVAVTGSNGKTTVKEMVASILRQLGPVLSTEGNLNNDIGVPLTLLRMRSEHRYAVIEMGANHVGEIRYLSGLAMPDVAVVTNVSAAHLEGFGSLERIVEAKSEIFSGVSKHGTAVINADDKSCSHMLSAAAHCRTITFGRAQSSTVRCGEINGVFTVKAQGTTLQPALSVLGVHNQLNATAAVAVATCLDVQIDTIIKGLEEMKPVGGRLQKSTSQSGAVVIDDTYNANPASMRAAIKVLAEYPGTRICILGDMKELGDDEIDLHAEIGVFAKQVGIDKLYAVGPLAAHAAHAFGVSAMSFASKQKLLEEIGSHPQKRVTYLVKGSRSSRMEDVVKELLVMDANNVTEEPTLS